MEAAPRSSRGLPGNSGARAGRGGHTCPGVSGMEAGMKLAEGLALRAGAMRRVEQLRARIVASASAGTDT